MKLLRSLLAALSILLLLCGFLGSQYYALTGNASQWAAQMDQPQIRLLATLIFCAALILTFIRDDSDGQTPEEIS